MQFVGKILWSHELIIGSGIIQIIGTENLSSCPSLYMQPDWLSKLMMFKSILKLQNDIPVYYSLLQSANFIKKKSSMSLWYKLL